LKIEALLAHRSQYETTLGIGHGAAGEGAQGPDGADGFGGRNPPANCPSTGRSPAWISGESFHRIEI